jgi:hypothetical protein
MNVILIPVVGSLQIVPSVIWIIILSFSCSLIYPTTRLFVSLLDNHWVNAYHVLWVITSNSNKEKLLRIQDR